MAFSTSEKFAASKIAYASSSSVNNWAVYTSGNYYAKLVGAAARASSGYLRIYGFGFSTSDFTSRSIDFISYSSRIVGVTFTLNCKTYSGNIVYDEEVYLKTDSGTGHSGNNKASGSSWGTSYYDKNYGSSSDTWGHSLDIGDVTGLNFGVLLKIQLGPVGAGDNHRGNVRMTTEGSDEKTRSTVYYKKPAYYPDISIRSATNIDYESATIRGDIDILQDYDEVDTQFCYREYNFGSADFSPSQTIADGVQTYNVSGNSYEITLKEINVSLGARFMVNGQVTCHLDEDEGSRLDVGSGNAFIEVTNISGNTVSFKLWDNVGAWTTTSSITRDSTGTYSENISSLDSETDYIYYFKQITSDSGVDSDYYSLETEHNSRVTTFTTSAPPSSGVHYNVGGLWKDIGEVHYKIGSTWEKIDEVYYNLFSWSVGGNLSVAKHALGGAGTQSAGLSFGGFTGSYSNATEEYNGTSWSGGGNLTSARYMLGGCGTQTAGLSFGGYNPSYSSVTEEYDGSSWSGGGNLNTARYGLAGCGTQSSGLSFGGTTGSRSNITEEYDGSSWSSGGNLSTARFGLAGCGTQSSALSFGGTNGASSYNITEEYDSGSWSSGGTLNTARFGLAGCGTQSSGLSFGGTSGGPSNVTEEYDGGSWSICSNLNTARYDLGGVGLSASGLSFGGHEGSGYSQATEEYNLSWKLLE